MADRDTVRCRHCECNQFRAARCRRCGRELFVPIVVRNPTPALSLDEIVGGAVLPTLAEMELKLFREALRRGGSFQKAATLIGVPKSTMYRQAKVMGLLEAEA